MKSGIQSISKDLFLKKKKFNNAMLLKYSNNITLLPLSYWTEEDNDIKLNLESQMHVMCTFWYIK